MAIMFDPDNKIIALDTFNHTASQIWSRWVDWVAISDNSKYPVAMTQLGGVAPVALYIFLENGWRVRPKEADGQTIIEGNLLVQGGGNPVVPTIGAYATQVFLETPLSAQAIEVGTSGLTLQESNSLLAIKTKTDSLVFTKPGEVDVNVQSMNGAEVLGNGTSADKWRGE